MRRILTLLLAGMLLVGFLASCGDDDDDDGGDGGGGTETTQQEGGGDGGGGASAEVEEYCNAVDEYVQAVQDDPTNPDLATQAQQLASEAVDLNAAAASPEEAAQITQCSEEAATALTGG
jgi:hypothetical protein